MFERGYLNCILEFEHSYMLTPNENPFTTVVCFRIGENMLLEAAKCNEEWKPVTEDYFTANRLKAIRQFTVMGWRSVFSDSRNQDHFAKIHYDGKKF